MAILGAAGAWLLGKAKSIWPWLLLAGAALLAVLGAWRKAESVGRSAEITRQQKRSLEADSERRKKDAEVARAGGDDLDKRLGRWMRHDGGS